MSFPQVSYVLGILNAERTFEKCLNGIFMQKFPIDFFEVIIVDGGSTDSTLNIIRRYQKKYKNIRLYHNPKKLAEGLGMSKDMGIKLARGDFVVLLDHDNIPLHSDWLTKLISPLQKDKEIYASVSQLKSSRNAPYFLQYVNEIGVEDPFAIPDSLIAQVQLHPSHFKLIKNQYYVYCLDSEKILYGGANGGAFRKEVFLKIGGHTQEADIFTKMANYHMKVAVPKGVYLNHETSSSFKQFLIKKANYFRRLLSLEYKVREFKWIKPGLYGKILFALRFFSNITLFFPALFGIYKALQTKRVFWILHPFYLFCITGTYFLNSLAHPFQFLRYISKSSPFFSCLSFRS
jgi:glycosyltransferase involved in cell wall biosynthesis